MSKRIMRGQVLVRLPENLAATVKAHAKSANQTDASVIRKLIVDAFDGEPEDIHEKKRALPAYAPPPDIVSDLRLAREVCGEATGAMVMLARIAREEGLSVHHAELERLIPSMRGYTHTFLDLSDEIAQHWREYIRGLK